MTTDENTLPKNSPTENNDNNSNNTVNKTKKSKFGLASKFVKRNTQTPYQNLDYEEEEEEEDDDDEDVTTHHPYQTIDSKDVKPDGTAVVSHSHSNTPALKSTKSKSIQHVISQRLSSIHNTPKTKVNKRISSQVLVEQDEEDDDLDNIYISEHPAPPQSASTTSPKNKESDKQSHTSPDIDQQSIKSKSSSVKSSGINIPRSIKNVTNMVSSIHPRGWSGLDGRRGNSPIHTSKKSNKSSIATCDTRNGATGMDLAASNLERSRSKSTWSFASQSNSAYADSHIRDGKWWNHQKIQNNLKIVFVCLFLVLGGMIMFIAGVALAGSGKQFEGTGHAILIVMGLLFIIPACYYLFALYATATGRLGFRFYNLPLFN